MEKRKDKKSNNGHSESLLEDYGDYVTRCICDFQHDDGYMICCDDCGVWQHIECMQVDTKNLPENYLCELCDPRPVDRKRARQAQIKKREDLSDLDDDDDDSPPPPGRKGIPPTTPASSMGGGVKKKQRRRGKSTETKPEPISKSTKVKKGDIPPSASIKKAKKKPLVGKGGQTSGGGGGGSRVSNIQSLLNAASILDGVGGGAESSPSGGRSKEHHRSTDIWNANLSPWSDKYDTIDHNRYSEPIRTFVSSHLSQLKSEAVVYSHDEYLTWDQRSQPQCSVAEVGRRRRGLTANANIPEDELVLEYMGKITVKQSVINEVAPESKLLWRHKPCPFVYCYDKISGVDMCIDARNSGTIARFMRRSCSPNSEIRHFFVSNELHFGVYALVNIAEGEEITLPFDFKFDKCEYMMECACGQPWTMCLVARAPKRHVTSAISSSSSSSSTKPNTASEHQTRAPSRQQSLTIISSAGDEDSNSSWTSSSGRKRSRHHHHGGGTGSGSGHGPLSPGSKSSHHHGHHPHHQASLEGTSESEEESAKEKEKRRKSLSREERKTEQIWKLVEKMEASQQRKQRQQLLSEGSLESDPLSSPSHSQNMTSHLFTSYKATPTSAGGKERKSSNNSRKTPLYPGSKMRLSSVSSTDALSPCDLSEAFSPPFTPGLATGPDAALTPSHVHPSPAPLLSPPPTISSHKPTFVVTPDLHPKYLFADFALPYKKAFLKQWEDEQRNRSSHAHPYWSNGHTYHLTEDRMRKRVRGSLKHRWLKQHREEREKELAPDSGGGRERDGDDKENLHSPAPLSHKKLMLLRWENSVLEKTKTSLPLSPPLSPHPSHPHQPSTSSKEEEQEEDERQPIKRHSSPLFEELSDEEFEEGRKTADSADGDKDTHGPKTPPIPASMDLEGAGDGEGGRGGDDVIMDQSTGADDSHKLTDDNLSSVSDTSLASCSGDEGVGPRTPPVEPNEPSSSLVNVGDISSGLDGEQALKSSQEDAPGNQAEKGGGDGAGAQPEERDIGGISVNKSETGGEAPGNQPPTATAMEETSAAASEDVLKSADSAELSGSDTVAMESTTNVLPGDDVPHPFLSDTASQQESAPPSPSAVGTPTKTPGKRKINLSEYRNRARKPVERKAAPEKGSPPQSSSSSSSTTSLLSTPSFLSQGSIASRILSSPSLSSYPPPLKLSSTPGAGGSLTASPLSSSSSAAAGLLGVPGGSGHSQFEPVSPDEDEKPASEDPSGGAASAGSVVGSLHPQQQQQQLISMSSVSYPHTQSILGPGDRAVMLGPGSAYLQQAPPTGVIAPSSQPPPLVHMVQGGGVLQTPPPPPPPGGQYAMWPTSSGAPVGEQAMDPRKGLIPIPGHAVAPQQQHTGLFPVHGGPLIQPGILQQQPILGPGGRGEFHHHGYVGHPPPPPGAPVYRPRPPGPGGNYY